VPIGSDRPSQQVGTYRRRRDLTELVQLSLAGYVTGTTLYVDGGMSA
jgi:NAD(P)-dependent dehydrogenase (short-subunit alcohol dehydrogenase family)